MDAKVRLPDFYYYKDEGLITSQTPNNISNIFNANQLAPNIFLNFKCLVSESSH